MTNIRNAFSAAIGLTLLGSSLLLGAGVASAASCPAGQHWNEMGGGSGFCSPDASGGGTGGNGVYTGTGGNTPAPQAPDFQAPAPYKAPVYGPAPAPAPIPAAPRPVAPAPIQIPVPAQNHAQVPIQIPAPAVQERPSNNVAEVARNQASTNHDAVVTEASKNKDAATEDKSEAKSVDKTDNEKLGAKSSSPESAKVTAEATSTPYPSVSEAANPSEIDASQASAVEPIMNAVLVIFCVGVLSYLTWGLVIKPRLNRKPSKTDESWSE